MNSKRLLDWLYPRRCAFCDEVLGNMEKYLCHSCQRRMPKPIGEPNCKKCGKPLVDERKEFCTDCGKKHHVYAVIVLLLAAAIIIIGGILLFYIQEIEVSGNEYCDSQEIVNCVQNDKLSDNS